MARMKRDMRRDAQVRADILSGLQKTCFDLKLYLKHCASNIESAELVGAVPDLERLMSDVRRAFDKRTIGGR